MAQDDGLRFGVLGPLEMSVDGSILPLATPKQRVVLAMLVVNRNRPVGVDALVSAAWEQKPPAAARANLHSYVSNLRRLMSSAGLDANAVLASAPPGYRLAVADSQCDLGRFNAEKNAGVKAAAAGQFEQASGHLSAALAEWRGPVLDDLRDFSFVDAFATALVEDKVVAHTARAEAEITCGRAHSVIAELKALTAEHPYREPLWAQLITAYYLTERQSDALDAYRRLKTRLVEDLGIDPGPQLRALHERILRQQPLEPHEAAPTSADNPIIGALVEHHATITDGSAVATLRDGTGRVYPLDGAATRIGRNSVNDIVLSDVKVSRHHAVIIDNGTSFVITDLRSSNGVHVLDRRIHYSVTLSEGDRIRIGDHEFTFESRPREPVGD